jgi:hypothetical protein
MEKTQKEIADEKRAADIANLEERIAALEEEIAKGRQKIAILQTPNAPIVYEYTIEAYDQRKGGGYRNECFVSKKTVTLRENVPPVLLKELYAWVNEAIDISIEEVQDLKNQLNTVKK